MKTFRQYYFEQKYWIWQTVFLMFFIAVTIAAIRSGEWETIIAVVLAAAINIGWYYRAKGIYNRLVRLGHEDIAPEWATHYGRSLINGTVFFKERGSGWVSEGGAWFYKQDLTLYNIKPIHRSNTPKIT